MPEPNHLLRGARHRLPSPGAPGEHASRAEVAEAVNAWLWQTTGKRYFLDAHYLAKLERGVARWPNAAYRSGLRHVLGATDDTALGFRPPRRGESGPTEHAPPGTLTAWDAKAVADHAAAITENDLMPPTRRSVLGTAATLAGAALAAELEPFLRPVTVAATRRGSAFTAPELDAAEALAESLRDWHRSNGALARSAVVAQLNAHTRRLREAPHDTPETRRAFRVGAELADIAATMTWDAGGHTTAQSYFVLAAQLARAAGDPALAAGILLSLARQCFYLDRADDGLEVVQLAQYATRRTATPRLQAALATREAWAHALMGNVRPFRRAVGVAEDCHTEGVRDGDPATPCARSLNTAELAGVIGGRCRELAQHDPRFAREAQDRITEALRLRPADHTRNRVFDLVELAQAHLLSREPERAAELITHTLPLATPWASGRAGAMLIDFHHAAAPYAAVPAVRDAREAAAELVSTN